MVNRPGFAMATLSTSHNALLDTFERHESAVAAAMRRAVLAEVPDYPASGDPSLLAEVQEHSLAHVRAFVASARRGGPPQDGELDFVGDRAVQRERGGMPLAAVLHAYRLGLREIWRALVELAAEAAAPQETVLEVTAHAMAYTDAISLAVTDAYSRAAQRRRADVEGERRDLLEDLLAGREVDGRAEELGVDLRIPLAVVVAGPPSTSAPRSGAAVPGPAGAPGEESVDHETLRRAAQAFERQAGTAPRSAFVVLHHGRVVALAPIGRGGIADLRNRVGRALSALSRAGHDRLAAGISLPLATLADAAHGHIEATRALRHAPAGTVVALSDVRLLDYLIEHAGSTARRIVPDWASVLDPDLVATLRTFAANDLNAAQTAPALNVHPNTVRYRLDRVLALTGRDPRHFLDLVDLLAAVALS
jgi:PucR C-terminal helix-turn-helix domain/GGDEF-like domain